MTPHTIGAKRSIIETEQNRTAVGYNFCWVHAYRIVLSIIRLLWFFYVNLLHLKHCPRDLLGFFSIGVIDHLE